MKFDRSNIASLIPVVIGSTIVIGGLSFLFLYDAKTNRFTNAPDAPFEVLQIPIDAPVTGSANISPDGGSVAFAAGDGSQLDIFVRSIGVDADVQLTQTSAVERNPVWSPDRQQIAFTRDLGRATAIVAVPFRGGKENTIATIEGEISKLDWSGNTIYFASRAGERATWSIFAVEVPTGNLLRVTAPQEGHGDHWFAVSPDGDQLVLARGLVEGQDNLFIRDLHTGEERRLTEDSQPIQGVDWAGGGIVYAVGEVDASKIWTISPTGLRGAELRTPPPVTAPSLSDDGRRILYRKGDGTIEVVVQP